MRQHARFSWVMAMLFFCAACAQSGPSDDSITASVKAGLAADATVKAAQVDVVTKDQIVTLTGRVETPAIKQQAVQIARQTDGVRDIVDNLQVQGTTSAPAVGAGSGGAPAASTGAAGGGAAPTTGASVGEATKEAGAAIGDAGKATGAAASEGGKTVGGVVVDGAKTAGSAVVEGAKVTGEVVSDAAVTTGKATAEGAETVAGGAKKVGAGIAGAVTGGDKENEAKK
ncbi:MAG TPA: BON domain-containing protein [Vicinamibacterales bacterium]|nr:BON domain-containing protein [Vicinamibacterales bacterium]